MQLGLRDEAVVESHRGHAFAFSPASLAIHPAYIRRSRGRSGIDGPTAKVWAFRIGPMIAKPMSVEALPRVHRAR